MTSLVGAVPAVDSGELLESIAVEGEAELALVARALGRFTSLPAAPHARSMSVQQSIESGGQSPVPMRLRMTARLIWSSSGRSIF